MIRPEKIKLSTCVVLALLTLTMVCLVVPARAQEIRCAFVDSAPGFAGSPQEQTKCLLRPVKMYGRLGRALENLPAPLDSLVGQPVNFKKTTLQHHLTIHHIDEADLGGSIAAPLSRANNNDPNAEYVRYFVIHDVSTPNYLDQPFPANINEKTWKWNDLKKMWADKKKAHVFINRVGESLTNVPFNTPFRATKFETKILGQKGKGLFLHVELIQPRRRDPNGGPQNDAIAPTPGFTEAQFERLALLYVAASVRRGQWLVPAYHAVIDAGIPDAHDDPQNFDLEQFASRLSILLKSLQAIEMGLAGENFFGNSTPAQNDSLPDEALERVKKYFATKLTSRYKEIANRPGAK